jgi:hypothetical protein
MHDFIKEDFRRKIQDGSGLDEQGDVNYGNASQAAIGNGSKIYSILIPRGSYLDIGTSKDLVKKTLHSMNWSSATQGLPFQAYRNSN